MVNLLLSCGADARTQDVQVCSRRGWGFGGWGGAGGGGAQSWRVTNLYSSMPPVCTLHTAFAVALCAVADHFQPLSELNDSNMILQPVCNATCPVWPLTYCLAAHQSAPQQPYFGSSKMHSSLHYYVQHVPPINLHRYRFMFAAAFHVLIAILHSGSLAWQLLSTLS